MPSVEVTARRAGVGLGTLYRHFPTREALLEALPRESFDALSARAGDLDGTDLFGLLGALPWLRDQPALAPRDDHLFDVIAGALLTAPPKG